MQDREPLDWSWLTYSRLRVLRELGADRTERQAANVYAVPGDTGWQVDWVTANYYGQYVPAKPCRDSAWLSLFGICTCIVIRMKRTLLSTVMVFVMQSLV